MALRNRRETLWRNLAAPLGNPTMTPARPGTPDRTEHAYACPVCGNWLEKKQNPSYGTGLAVHPYILVCAKCGWVNLEPVAATAVPVPAPAPRGFFAWLGLRRRD